MLRRLIYNERCQSSGIAGLHLVGEHCGAERVGNGKFLRLLDHLVRGCQQRFRDREAECLRGLEVYSQLELGGCLNW
jgi:hypothetical protein